MARAPPAKAALPLIAIDGPRRIIRMAGDSSELERSFKKGETRSTCILFVDSIDALAPLLARINRHGCHIEGF